jgi:hypothetical protein
MGSKWKERIGYMEKVLSMREHEIVKSLKELRERGLVKLNHFPKDSNDLIRLKINPRPICSGLNYIRSISYPNDYIKIAQLVDGDAHWMMYSFYTFATNDLDKRALLRKAKKVKIVSVTGIDEDDGIEKIVEIDYKTKVNNQFSLYTVKRQLVDVVSMFCLFKNYIDLSNSIIDKNGHYLNVSEAAKANLLKLAENFGLPIIYSDDQLFYQEFS